MDLVYLGAQMPGTEFFWALTPGRHTVSLLDEEGRTAKSVFEVEDLREENPKAVHPERSTAERR